MPESAISPAEPDTGSPPLDFATMLDTARRVVGSGAGALDAETATLLLRGHLALLVPEAQDRLGRLADAAVGEARRCLDAGSGPLGAGRHAYDLARSVIALCAHLGHGHKGMRDEPGGREPWGREPWTPPVGTTVELVPVGRHWDAVRVRSHIGERVIERLGADSGAVIEDWHGRVLYWLVPLGTADTWDLPLSVVVPLGVATFVAVPPVSYTDEERLRWIVPLTATRYLTDPELLHHALTTEISVTAGPR
ncbi:DUF6415 family natural product biosynthesis protein [Streptomyces sp. NPDC002018]|uniref:DUF6415 family natural product biosynthesis protein n=1 Tax=Streptomyces sp. NPDC002018 TaxID=3364629 RepID=UPI00369946B3